MFVPGVKAYQRVASRSGLAQDGKGSSGPTMTDEVFRDAEKGRPSILSGLVRVPGSPD